MTANVKCTVEQRSQTVYETYVAYHQLVLIYCTCSSSLQSELYITYANTPTAISRFKNIIWKTSVLLQLSNFPLQSSSLHPL